MTTVLYGIIIIFATFMGAFVGLGGGVIIKPLLDLIGKDSVAVVNFISTCAVFSMSISSTVKHIRSKTKIDFKLIISLSVGAVIGGILGSKLFDYLLGIFNNNMLKSLQGLILGILLVISVIYINIKNAKSFKITNPICIAAVGLTLGFIASFLGVKEAAIYSVGTIFFSQLSKLITLGVTHTVPKCSILTLAVAIICAVAGGILGAKMNKKGNEKVIKTIFTIVVALIALVNFYNAIVGFTA